MVRSRAMSPAKLRHKFPLFVGFGPSEFDSLEKCLVRRRYPGGQALFHMGDEGGSLLSAQRPAADRAPQAKG